MTDQLNDLSNALFAVKISKSNSPEPFGSVDDFAWEFAIESHLGQYCVDDRFVKVMEVAMRYMTCG